MADSPSPSAPRATGAAGCPVHGGRKVTRPDERPGPAVERRPDGSFVVRDLHAARQVLRNTDAHQAGFNREAMRHSPVPLREPILYMEGDAHRDHRAAIARFFTPTTTDARYRAFMEAYADAQIERLIEDGRADLSRLAMDLAVQVAARVVGLTDSARPGMERRLEAFFASRPQPFSWRPRELLGFLRTQLAVLRFFRLDVRPAIAARRDEPRDDVISHLIGKGYKDADILIECITFGAAGMVTTREFIVMAAWHLLEAPALKTRFVEADEAERHAILGEILRLEPVVGRLYRRAARPIRVETADGELTLPAGCEIVLELRSANADPGVFDRPLELCPGRDLPRGVQPPVLGFGDGHHRCPGAYVALQESDIFLRKLLALPGLTLEGPPSLAYDPMIEGYELREARLRLDG